MVIEVRRVAHTNRSTIGEMWIDGVFEAYTLEDCVREVPLKPVAEWKIPGQTAIPAGTYDVVIDFSNRFQRRMPHILDVPGFTGVRIHAGNTDKDTEGCILLGQEKGTDFIGHSKAAFDTFFQQLQDAIDANQPVTVTVTNETQTPTRTNVVQA
jgi:hypothetical protein